MDFAWLIPLLALITIFAVLVFALVDKERTDRRLERDKSAKQKSALATDGDSHSVAG